MGKGDKLCAVITHQKEDVKTLVATQVVQAPTIVVKIINRIAVITVTKITKIATDVKTDMKTVVTAEIITETNTITDVVNRIVVIIGKGIVTEGNSVFVVTASTN